MCRQFIGLSACAIARAIRPAAMARRTPLIAITFATIAAAALAPAAGFECLQGSACDGLSEAQLPRCQEAQLTFYNSCAELLATPLGEPASRDICTRECREAAVAWQVRAQLGSPKRRTPPRNVP